MNNYFFNIERHNGAALVQIIEIIKDDNGIRPGCIVEEYETSSIGATKSARKSIKKYHSKREENAQ